MDGAGVPADSELRRAENIFFPEDIREIPESNLPSEKLLPAQAALPDTDVPRGERVDKEAQPPTKDKPSEDSLRIRDVVSQAKDTESNPKLKVLIPRLLIPRKIPLRTRPRILDVGFSSVTLFLFSILVAFATACNINFL